MTEDRPFFRVFHITREQAAAEQIEGAIRAFYDGHFAIAITLAAAAEGMSSLSTGGGLWASITNNPNRLRLHDNVEKDKKLWSTRLNETRDWLKHDKSMPNRNLAAVEAGIFILRAMDKWEPWSADMVTFKELWFTSPKLLHPDEYHRT